MDHIKPHPADLPQIMDIVLRRAYREGGEAFESKQPCPYNFLENHPQWEAFNRGFQAAKERQKQKERMRIDFVPDGALDL